MVLPMLLREHTHTLTLLNDILIFVPDDINAEGLPETFSFSPYYKDGERDHDPKVWICLLCVRAFAWVSENYARAPACKTARTPSHQHNRATRFFCLAARAGALPSSCSFASGPFACVPASSGPAVATSTALVITTTTTAALSDFCFDIEPFVLFWGARGGRPIRKLWGETKVTKHRRKRSLVI